MKVRILNLYGCLPMKRTQINCTSYSRLPMMIVLRSLCSPKSDGIPPDNAFVPMHQVTNQVLKEINKIIDMNIVYK